MGPFSTCRALAHWQRLLLAVSLLNISCLAIKAHFGIQSIRVMEGEDVILNIGNNTLSPGVLTWYKGSKLDKNGLIAVLSHGTECHMLRPKFGRGTINQDGSLLLKNVTTNDTGLYNIIHYRNDSEIDLGFRHLKVYEYATIPTLFTSNTTVRENDTVVLTCYSNAVNTQWYFNGTNLQLTERMNLSKDHRVLTIDPVKEEDAGDYECEAINYISYEISWPLELHVKDD